MQKVVGSNPISRFKKRPAFAGLLRAISRDLAVKGGDRRRLGRCLGALYTSAGVGAPLGPLFAGAAIDMTGGYLAAIVIAATAGVVGALAVRSSLQIVSGTGC